jgi:hypothetical protein
MRRLFGGRWCGRRAASTAAALLVLPLLALGPEAGTASAAGGGYGSWRMSGQTGSLSFPVTGFPAATVATTSSSPAVPGGSSTFLGPATPFGAEFGSSRGHNYLSVRTAPAGVPSVTTIDFASPTPAGGWGFALGDIDADHMQISATGADGQPLTADQLGWQSAFNYCAVSPRPGTCTRPPFTDEPTWDPATSTLVGNVVDTDGGAGWFKPTVPIRSMTLTFSVQSGIPVGQIWMAALHREISGKVSLQDGTPPPSTTLQLRHADGSRVLDADGNPVTAVTDDQGRYSFPDVAAADYQVVMRTPSGFQPVGPTRRSAETVRRSAYEVDFVLKHKPVKAREQQRIAEPPVDLPKDAQQVEIPLPPVDGSPVTDVSVVSPPEHGSVDFHDGVLTYHAEPGCPPEGVDRIAYEAYNRAGRAVLRETTVRYERCMGPTLAATGTDGRLAPLGVASVGLLLAGAGAVVAARRLRRG